jgi:hypothetical protein
MKARGKNKSFLGVVPEGGEWAQGKGNEGEYGGCILYLHMKIGE